MEWGVGLERHFRFNRAAALTYANSNGLHLFRSENINAPFTASGVYPLGRPGAVLLMESGGLYNQNQLILNVNTRVNRSLSLNGSYVYNVANSNTDGLRTFPAKPYSIAGGYRPTSTHR